MSQKTVASDEDAEYDEIREEMMTTKGVERSTLDLDDGDHALSGMDSKRKAPVEAVAKNVVDRYDQTRAFIREFMANAHTACIQRAKWELRQAGVDDLDYTDVRAVLERAKNELGYEPVIEIVRNENPEDFSLKIKDNGVGVPSQTAYAIRDIGLSGWHDDGTTNGQFGQGTMSGFLPVDHYGEFDMTTWSVMTDENYRARWKLTDLDKLPGERDAYGTTFTWPYFTDEAQDIDTYDAVREYAEGMIVPVIYEHYDEDGTQNGNLSDDWAGDYIEDRYADDSPLVIYEDDYGKAVWSPDGPEGWSTDIKTWCGYQPIDRNDSGFSVNSYTMPSAFDIRIKVENGPVIAVPDDADDALVGKIPVSQNRYEHLPEDQRDEHVIRGDVPDEAVIAPEPTDDRDRFESKHVDDCMRYYADQLESRFTDRVGAIIDDLDGLESLPEMDDVDRQLLLNGIDEYITVYAQNEAERLQDEIEEAFGVRPDPTLALNIGVVKREFGNNVSDDFAKAVGRMKQAKLGGTGSGDAPMDVDSAEEYFADTISGMTDEVSLAERGTSRPGRASNRTSTPVWDLLEKTEDGGTVYMAKSLTCERKARLAWELDDDNQVVVVDRYEKWAEMYDWAKLKNLPSRNYPKAFPDHDFDDDWLDQWDPASGDSDDDSGSDLSNLSYDTERAKRRDVTIRTETGHGSYDEIRGEELHEALDSDGSFTIGYTGPFDTLLLYKQTEGHSASVGSHLADETRGIAYAVVPEYVYEYLHTAENAVTPNEYRQRRREQWIDFDWSGGVKSGDEIGELDEHDVFIDAKDDLIEPIESRGLMIEFVSALEDRLAQYDIDRVDSITFVTDADQYYEVLNKQGCIDGTASDSNRPTLVDVDTGSFGRTNVFGYGYYTMTTLDVEQVFFDCVLPDLDRDTIEWAHFSPSMDDGALIDALQDLSDAGGFVSTDDVDLPDHVGDGAYCVDPHRYYIERTMARFADATDFLDCQNGGDA